MKDICITKRIINGSMENFKFPLSSNMNFNFNWYELLMAYRALEDYKHGNNKHDFTDMLSLWIDQGAIDDSDDLDGGENCAPGWGWDCNDTCQNLALLNNDNCDDGEEGEADFNCEEHYYLKYDLAGYIVANIPCVGMSDVKGINSVHYSIKTNATERLIQAKLLNTKTILDALPGSIPVYFASDADFYAEPVTGYIIKGDVTSTFYLDLAALNDPTKEGPTSTDDLQPVFVIEIHPELGDDQAEQMQSQIYTNKNIVTWWTNFDTPFDFILPVLILISAVCFVFASKKFSEEELSSLVKEDTFEESE